MYAADLSRIHHEGFGFVARNAATDLLGALRSAEFSGGTVVDLGCGSGILSKELVDGGYDIYGVDFSEDMIALARVGVPSGRFARASFLDAEIPECVAVAAVGEIFCYAFDPRAGIDQFARMAKRIYAALVPGGVFLFDVAGPGRSGALPRTGFVDNSDWSIVHRTTEEGDTLTRAITTFVRDGAVYRRSDETHVLRLYRPEDIEVALASAGFQTTRLSGYGEFTLPSGWYSFQSTKP